MHILSVICELDPLHRGHEYLLTEARRACGADYTVCLMSGPFKQRGEPARYDKRVRARAALLQGADLVLELPVRFACAAADDFARGGIVLAKAMGGEGFLGFGCETQFLPYIKDCAEALRNCQDLSLRLAPPLSRGLSYPAALGEALRSLLPGTPIPDTPNALLSLAYLLHLPPDMTPVPIPRQGQDYHDLSMGPFSSASAIRLGMAAGRREEAAAEMPEPEPFLSAEAQGHYARETALDTAILYRLRTMTVDTLSQIAGVSEGLENRLIACARQAGSREELLSLCKTRRYSYARLSRILTCALLGITRQDLLQNPVPQYLRVLGFRRSAQPLLHHIKAEGTLPLITRACDVPSTRLFALDQTAQDLWALSLENPTLRRAGQDLISAPVIVDL